MTTHNYPSAVAPPDLIAKASDSSPQAVKDVGPGAPSVQPSVVTSAPPAGVVVKPLSAVATPAHPACGLAKAPADEASTA